MAQWGGERGTQQVAIIFVFLALASIVLSLRLFTRFVLVRNHGLEDFVIMAAFGLSTAYAVFVLIEVQHGQGLSDSDLSPEDLLFLKKALWQSIPIYLAALTLTKLSILLQYMRLFKGRFVHRLIIAMVVFVCSYGTWSVVGSVFLCFPTHYFWDQTANPEDHCMNFAAKWFSDASVNILTDLIILGLPMPYLKSLNLPRRQKAGLMAVFALGGFVCLVSIARLRPLYVIATASDVSKSNAAAAWLSSLEVNVAIICASLPCLRAITLNACTRRKPNATAQDTARAGPWRFGRGNEGEEEKGECDSAITKAVTVQMDSARRDSARKWSVWSEGAGGIWDAGAAKAWVRSGG